MGDNVMRGYYKDYERTLSVFTEDGWFRTGDVATVDKKGRYSIKGRLGSVILGPSGENIYPEEILKFVNERVNRSSRISDVEVEKEPFIKTATLKIKRFLYKEKESMPNGGADSSSVK